MTKNEAIQSTWFGVEAEAKPVKAKLRLSVGEKASFLLEAIGVGGYVPVGVAGKILGVSRQRVYQLIETDKLEVREFAGVLFIAGRSITARLEETSGSIDEDLKRTAEGMKLCMKTIAGLNKKGR